MTAPSGGTAAAVWVSILPDLSNFGRQLTEEMRNAGAAAGDQGGRAVESSFGRNVKRIAAVGATIGAAVGVAVVGAMNIEKANDKLAAQLGLTESESARVGGVAGSLFSNAYGGSLDEVNTAVGAVISSIDGMGTASSATLEGVSANALDFASAFGVDVEGAVASVGTLMRNGLAPNATEAFDLITAASQRVPAAMRGDVLEAADEYGGFFNTLGFSGEQTFAALVDASAKGSIGIDKVGDAIKEFSIKSTDLSSTSRDAYAAIGLDAETMANKILTGGSTAQGATQQIIDGLLSITDPSAQASAAIGLFGTPLEDLNVAEIPAFLESMRGASGSMAGFEGSAGRLGQALNDNAATNIESFKRQITAAFIDTLGNRVLPIVSAVATFLVANFGPALASAGAYLTDTIIPALQGFGRWLYDARIPLGIITGIIVAVFIPHLIALGVTATISAARTAAAWVVTQVAAVRAAIVHSGQVLAMIARWVLMGARSLANAALVAAAWLIIGSSGAAAMARSAVAFAVIMGQWLALAVQSQVQAARVVVAWLFSSSGPIAAAAVYVVQVGIMVGAWVLLGVQSLIAAARVAAAWLIAMGPIGLVIIAVVALVALIIANWDTVKRVTAAVFTFIGNFLRDTWNNIRAGFSTAVTFIAGLWNGFWNGLRQVATTVWNAVAGFIGTVWNAIRAGFNTSVAFLRGLWGTFWSGLQQVATTVFNAVRGFIDTVWGAIRAGFGAATAFLRGMWDAWWAGLRRVGETVFNAIRAVIDTVWAAIRAGFNTAVTFLRALWDAWWAGLRTVANTVFTAIRTSIDFVWNVIRAGFQAATSFVTGLWDRFWSGLRNTASTVFNAIKGAIDTVIGGIIGAFRFVVSQVGTIWAGIKRLLAVPINFMITTVYNGGIVKAWNFVAGLLGIGSIKEIDRIPEFAKGGPVRGDQIIRAGEAGDEFVLSAPAIAGLGGMGAVDEMHRRAIQEPVSLRELNSGRYVEGADHNGPGTITQGFGGVRPHVAQAGHFLRAKFGVRTVGGVGSRPGPSDHPRGLALDFMTYGDTAKGDRLSAYAVQNAAHLAMKYIIWKQRINKGDGWKGMPDRGSPTANHMDHPHISFLDGPGGGRNFSAGGAEGGFLSFIGDQVRRLYDGATGGLVDIIRGLVGNPPPRFREIPPAMAAAAIKSVGDFLFGKADAADGGGEGGAAGVGAVMDQVRAVANRYGWGGPPQWDALSRLIQKESSWDPNAQNPTSTAYGLFQFLNSTWGTVGATKTSNPGLQAEAGLRYIKNRYGTPAGALGFHNRNNYYDSGGWMQPGFGTYFNGTGKPEAVLTDQQWSALTDRVQGGDDRSVVVNMEVNNPVAERGSDTAVRKLRTAAALGMFG